MNIVIIALLLLLNYKFKSFQEIKKHFPSLVYVVTFNALYYYLCKHSLVWDFKSKYLSIRTLRALHIFVGTPLIILLYLAKFPRRFVTQIGYFFTWIICSVAFEIYAVKSGILFFQRGWNFFWSLILYIKMYLYSLLFKKHKLIVLGISILTTTTALLIFKIPLRRDFLLGPLHIWLLKKNRKLTSYIYR